MKTNHSKDQYLVFCNPNYRHIYSRKCPETEQQIFQTPSFLFSSDKRNGVLSLSTARAYLLLIDDNNHS